MNIRNILSVVAVLVGGTALTIWWERPPPRYEDCMLDEMRGQPQTMWTMAHVKCAKRSKKEFPMDYSGDMSWSFDIPRLLIIFRDTGEMKPTRGTFRMSSKACDESKDVDFIAERRLTADEDGDFIDLFVPTISEAEKGFSTPVCMKKVSLYGIYADRAKRGERWIKWFD